MTPAIVLKDGKAIAAPRQRLSKIMNCVSQVAMNLVDHGLSMQPAASAPRIDASMLALYASLDLGSETIEGSRSFGHTVVVKD